MYMNVLNPCLKPSRLVASSVSRGRKYHKLILYSIKIELNKYSISVMSSWEIKRQFWIER